MPGKRKRRKAPRPLGEERVREAAALKKVKALIRNRPPFRDEQLAPNVDHGLLLALIRQELPERTAREVHRWVILFKSWSDAYCNLLVHEIRATQASSTDTP